MSKFKQTMLIIALALNIAGAANMYGKYVNILFGIHLALIISLIVDLLRTNITINNNFNDNRS